MHIFLYFYIKQKTTKTEVFLGRANYHQSMNVEHYMERW